MNSWCPGALRRRRRSRKLDSRTTWKPLEGRWPFLWPSSDLVHTSSGQHFSQRICFFSHLKISIQSKHCLAKLVNRATKIISLSVCLRKISPSSTLSTSPSLPCLPLDSATLCQAISNQRQISYHELFLLLFDLTISLFRYCRRWAPVSFNCACTKLLYFKSNKTADLVQIYNLYISKSDPDSKIRLERDMQGNPIHKAK